jgi:ferredoxin
MFRRSAPEPAGRLMVDPIACAGIGLCSHLAPALVDLDRWGYPVVPADDLTRSGLAQARRAVRGCPRRALAIAPKDQPAR